MATKTKKTAGSDKLSEGLLDELVQGYYMHYFYLGARTFLQALEADDTPAGRKKLVSTLLKGEKSTEKELASLEKKLKKQGEMDDYVA
jgi:hypothetical protein